MAKVFAALMVLLLVLLRAPSSAQALMSSLLPDLFSFGTSEPAMLFLTGMALLSLSRVGSGTRNQ